MNRNHVFGNSSNAVIATITKPLQEVCHEGLVIANSRKLFCPDFSIIRGLTTADDQYELFKKGRLLVSGLRYEITDKNKVVTNCDGYSVISDHQKTDEFGLAMAFDFCAWVDGTNYDDYNMALIATCFFEAASNQCVDIDWGGSYRSLSDGSHVGLII